MKDLIYRQETIEALGERPRFSTGGGYEMGVKEQYDRDLLAIINMPSAQPERKRGKWVFYEDRSPVWDIAGEKTWARAYKCSECSFVHSVIEDFGQYAFCPNCGADMREVDDERPD